MNRRRVTTSGALLALLLVVVLVAGTLALAACGSAESSSTIPSVSATPTSPSASPASSTSGPPSANRLNLPSGEIMAALEGRTVAWMRGEHYEAAAAFYARDGVLKELDVTPHT